MKLPNSILTRQQVNTYGPKLLDGQVIEAEVRHDDQCGNGHNSFAITATIYGTDRIPYGHHTFDRKTLKFFGETMKNYRVGKTRADGLVEVFRTGGKAGNATFLFNPATGACNPWRKPVERLNFTAEKDQAGIWTLTTESKDRISLDRLREGDTFRFTPSHPTGPSRWVVTSISKKKQAASGEIKRWDIGE